MKEQSDNKVPLIKMSYDDPLSPSSTWHDNDKVDSDNNNLGESNMIKEKIFKNSQLLGEYIRVAKWTASMSSPMVLSD